MPDGAAALAASDVCPIQAIRAGSCAYGIQFHVEITADTVGEWGCIPEYAAALDEVMGEGALARLGDETAARLPELNAAARMLYDNFMGMTDQA